MSRRWRVPIGGTLTLTVLTIIMACGPDHLPGLPPDSPFAEEFPLGDLLSEGVATGEVTDHSAVVWFRTSGPAKARVVWKAADEAESKAAVITTDFETDYTARVILNGLRPDRLYTFYVLAGKPGEPEGALLQQRNGKGLFATAASPATRQRVTFLWSGDLGGQQRCRRGADGYPIFERMRTVAPHFAILLGDTIYGDDRCPSPPNEPGGDFLASTVEEYRTKHRYQRGAASLRQFLSAVPIYVQWDDHEVRNNFSGPHDPTMPAGRQAFFDYWPLLRPQEDPHRLYRRVRWGADVELFLLDTRQYRSGNAEKDGPQKTMLGQAQRTWLLNGLRESTATWKFIVSSVPLSIPKGGSLTVPGNDSWARGADGTGFLTELQTITETVLADRIRTVVWLSGDVHYAQVNQYDPDRDGEADFYEFVCGPLSAAHGRLTPPNPDLNPTTVYNESGFDNFGTMTVDQDRLSFVLRDGTGAVRFTHTVHARHATRSPH